MRNFLAQDIKLDQVIRWLGYTVGVLAVIATFASLLMWRMWQIRGDLEDTNWKTSMVASEPGESVTATWLGTSTVLFDDGETQILIDGAFTRIGALDALLFNRVSSDIATINYALARFQMNRLAAIVPVHSHFDHAIDVGHVANRTSAVVLGSESTANIVRGADVPVDQYQILGDGEVRQFGNFTIKLIASVHAPIGANEREIFPGIIDIPLRQPARISEYRTGVAWAIHIGHPRGATLVQGSGGYIEGKLSQETANVVMLGLGKVASLGPEYMKSYWDETVVATGASRVIAIHHDDYTAPFGEVRSNPIRRWMSSYPHSVSRSCFIEQITRQSNR
jgi:L-ascorbate metabolism protein UlaG (beta-lactamase superfamily)